MSNSAPPPAPSSFREYLQRSAAVSRAVASLLIVLSSVHFAIASVRRAIDVSTADFTDRPLVLGLRGAPVAPPVPSPAVTASAPPPAPHASASGGASGKSLRVSLAIAYGPPRSEVYVNGRLVGHTPFLGDTSCKAGMPLRIEIVGDRGLPLTYSRECRGTLEITTAPP